MGYTLTTGNDNASHNGRNPKSWVLYGCNDYSEAEKSGGTWEALHTVTNDTVLKDENKKAFDFSCDKIASYKYFKLEIKSTAGSELMQLSELSLKIGESVNAADVYFINVPTTHWCGHTWVTTGEEHDADCISPSYKDVKCTSCGATGRVKTGQALLGHTSLSHCTRCGRKNLVQVADKWLSCDTKLVEGTDYTIDESYLMINISTSKEITLSNIDMSTYSKYTVTVISSSGSGNLVLAGLYQRTETKNGSDFRLDVDTTIKLAENTVNLLQGATDFATLPSIYVKKSLLLCGNGELIAAVSDAKTRRRIAIGSVDVCDITIKDCTVTAYAGKNNPAIGIGYMNNSPRDVYPDTSQASITIDGATVTAYGGRSGAGIGASAFYKACNITICNGAKVEAHGGSVDETGGAGGAGIGAGDQGSAANILIKDSDVVAYGGQYAAGIGNGWNSAIADNPIVSNIKILGSNVKAYGGENGAGIGGGLNDTDVSDIYISNSNVTAQGGANGAGIGSGKGDVTDITIKNSTVTAKSIGTSGGTLKNVIIDGSSVKTSSIGDKNGKVQVTNSSSVPVYLVTVPNPKGNIVDYITADGKTVQYPVRNHIAVDETDTNLYGYFPAGVTKIRASGEELHGHIVDGEYKSFWKYDVDSNNHWEACGFEGCDKTKNNKSPHSFSQGFCTVCGYEMDIDFRYTVVNPINGDLVSTPVRKTVKYTDKVLDNVGEVTFYPGYLPARLVNRNKRYALK